MFTPLNTNIMRERIRKIIDNEQLTSTKFADIISVQRSSVSHILSGRNNPSLEVVQKILTSFSTLNSEWLLFGRGQMYKNQEDKQSKIFEEEQKSQKIEKEKKKEKIKEPTNVKSDKEEDNSQKENNSAYSTNLNSSVAKTEKIIIFNSDKTYVEYSPKL